ncbi:MAG: hypothetical protein DI586_10440 [Micavibrio aeruginosavorus]|uniref:Uncharacterized protein n=1 Tax=Micavibrio aeruginosavorus TaxID=349221 RepID=A0A2W5HJN6_9BACT|nr:MAG: hypothetical protein DI586_10440 [Micavibrio aeruginosavorus]
MKDARPHQTSGSALVYILVAIALLAVLTASLMEPASQQSQAQNSTNLISEVSSQISLISSTIQECVLTYPDQDSSLTTTEQKNSPYPINPKDAYFSTSTPAASADNSVRYIRCPGNPGGTGATRKNHALLFGSSSGRSLPPPPNLFGEWEYYNGADGIFFFTSTSKTDSYIASALTKLDAKYSKCEADIIDATASDVNISSDTTGGATAVRKCLSGNRCFRYWVVHKSTSVAKEAGCPD